MKMGFGAEPVFKCYAQAVFEIKNQEGAKQMIITHKEFPEYRKFEIEYEGRPLKMEVGKMAELCNAAVLVTYGETTVLHGLAA